MDVSIIIVNYKTPDLVTDCVNSIKEKTQDISYEIIVVDNASGDNSAEILKREFRNEIKVIETEVNLGFGKANNLGVSCAQGEYVFLLNSDTVLINNAIKILYDYIRQNKEIGVVGGNLYSVDMKENSSFSLVFDDIETLKRKARWRNIIKETAFRVYRQKFYSEEQKRHFAYKNTFNYTDSPLEVAYIFGTDMMLSRKLYNEMKGFDPDFFMYAEEEELSWRIHKAGYKSVNVPQAKIVHLDGGTFKRDDSFNARQYGMRMTGAMTYYKKRYGIEGVEAFYKYKMLRLKRSKCLAIIFKKKSLYESSVEQMGCLVKQYKIFKFKENEYE